jgi:hypothetical protein
MLVWLAVAGCDQAGLELLLQPESLSDSMVLVLLRP